MNALMSTDYSACELATIAHLQKALTENTITKEIMVGGLGHTGLTATVLTMFQDDPNVNVVTREGLPDAYDIERGTMLEYKMPKMILEPLREPVSYHETVRGSAFPRACKKDKWQETKKRRAKKKRAKKAQRRNR